MFIFKYEKLKFNFYIFLIVGDLLNLRGWISSSDWSINLRRSITSSSAWALVNDQRLEWFKILTIYIFTY